MGAAMFLMLCTTSARDSISATLRSVSMPMFNRPDGVSTRWVSISSSPASTSSSRMP